MYPPYAHTQIHFACYAAKNGLTSEIVKLHAAGAKVNFFDPEMLQSTPLHWAANNGHVDTIQKLVELGARSVCRWSMIHRSLPLPYCAPCGPARVHPDYHLLPTHPRVRLRFRTRTCHLYIRTRTHLAHEHAHEHAHSVHPTNQHGWTALHHAANWGYIDCVKKLLDLGADPYAQSESGKTPMEVC
jgi:ankyrin repeat protein